MDLTKFFNSKKRDLSNNSNAEEDAKRQREESPSESPNVSMLDTPKTFGDVFEESLKSEDCVKILQSCLRNLEEEMKDIHKLALSSNSNQINREKQLADLSESIKFMSDKFDKFEKERQEEKKVIEELRGEVSSLHEKINSFTEQVDRQEQYSRRKCLLIHGITEGNQENTDDLALEILRKLDIELTQSNRDRTHWICKNDKRSNPPTSVIVKFIWYNDRKKIFSKKKQLKNSGISITESLTK